MRRNGSSREFLTILFTAAGLLLAGCSGQPTGETSPESPAASGKIPITTSSEEARDLYLQGRDLTEKLRFTEAHDYFVRAVQKDPSFALAWVGAANTADTANEFFHAMKKAVEAAASASEGEKLLVMGLDAGMRGDPEGQENSYTKLVELYPNDERAQNQLGAWYFGRQEYEAAVAHYLKATEINPEFSTPYNQLGYAYRFLGNYAEAEKAFTRYIELIPDEPNPYDSYAELLLKLGRHEESIENYRKALEHDPAFAASYVGIALNQVLMDKPDEARKTLGELAAKARTSAERRQAHTWTAATWLFEGQTDKALEEVQAMYSIAEADSDPSTMSGDLDTMGTILLEAGKPDEAADKYSGAEAMMEGADVPQEVKDQRRRFGIYLDARVALAKNDLERAATDVDEYGREAMLGGRPFEMRLASELSGCLALARKDATAAVEDLAEANQQSPRVLLLLAEAWKMKGDMSKAKEYCQKAADFNAPNFQFALVRNKARSLLSTLG